MNDVYIAYLHVLQTASLNLLHKNDSANVSLHSSHAITSSAKTGAVNNKLFNRV